MTGGIWCCREYFTQNIMQDSTWSINDLSNPNNRRTLMIIHKLIGFFLFAEERYSEMEEIFKEQVRIVIEGIFKVLRSLGQTWTRGMAISISFAQSRKGRQSKIGRSGAATCHEAEGRHFTHMTLFYHHCFHFSYAFNAMNEFF